ncbi:hypothetical protein SLE2022_222790 [Rubroshorea leprosula]
MKIQRQTPPFLFKKPRRHPRTETPQLSPAAVNRKRWRSLIPSFSCPPLVLSSSASEYARRHLLLFLFPFSPPHLFTLPQAGTFSSLIHHRRRRSSSFCRVASLFLTIDFAEFF